MTAAGPANEDRFNFFKARITSGRCGVPVPVWDPDEDELDVSEHIPYEGNNERNDGSSDDDDIESSESEEPIQWFRHRSPPVTLNWLFDEGAGPAGNL